MVRPNFRGVEANEGTHDHGIGETEDLLVLTAQVRATRPTLPLALVGFSLCRHFCAVEGSAQVGRRGRSCASRGFLPAGRWAALSAGDGAARHLIVHGESDENRVPRRAATGSLVAAASRGVDSEMDHKARWDSVSALGIGSRPVRKHQG